MSSSPASAASAPPPPPAPRRNEEKDRDDSGRREGGYLAAAAGEEGEDPSARRVLLHRRRVEHRRAEARHCRGSEAPGDDRAGHRFRPAAAGVPRAPPVAAPAPPAPAPPRRGDAARERSFAAEEEPEPRPSASHPTSGSVSGADGANGADPDGATAPGKAGGGIVVVSKRERRRWIRDRVNGASMVGEDHPPLRCCTVPPCVALCPTVLEQNCLCESIGGLGFIDPDNNKRARKLLMLIGLVTQLVGMLLTAVSCFAISTNYDLLMSLGFTRGVVTGTNYTDINVAVGLRAVAIDNPNPGRVGKAVATFDEFCTLMPRQSSNQSAAARAKFDAESENLSTYLDPSDCGECAAVSRSMVASLILSVVTYFPTIFTDILRMYPNYDVNCQKSFGFVMGLFGLAMSINTWLQYSHNCVNNFYTGWVPHDADGFILVREDADEAVSHYEFVWREGPGLICLITATFLKVVDIICHFLLPTPSIARDHGEQAEYEKMSRKEETAEWGDVEAI